MNQEKVKGLLACILAVSIWGGVFAIKGYLVNYLSAFQINFFNALITVTIYGLICLVQKTSLKVSLPMAKRMLIAGIVGIMGSRLTCDTGIKLVGSVTASVFVSVIPVMCVIYDMVFYKKKMNKRTIVGALVSILGVYIIVSSGEAQSFSIVGMGSLFLSNLAWIFYSYICADASKLPKSRIVMLFYQFLGSLMVLSTIVFTVDPIPTQAFTNVGVVAGILFLGVFNGVIAYICFAYATKVLGVITTNGINNCIPIMTMIFSVLFFGASVSGMQAFGVLLTVGAITVVAISQMEKIPKS
ncbi:DMT family transporter [Chakrabartyella piscis]|uniref:DMT family transporter n=1 Tax=Chakrabartyella piscis TaxID=2918914 RepID=UPI0029585A85|nr:DMT family transporter [Chakrabartyella piscis]